VFEHAGSWTGFELEGQKAAAAENQLQSAKLLFHLQQLELQLNLKQMLVT